MSAGLATGALPAMTVTARLRSFAMLPVWTVQLITGAKSRCDNPLLESRRLNRWGLHRTRVRAANAMCRWRRRRLAGDVPAEWRDSFDRDGFVVLREVLPPAIFVRLQQSVRSHEAPAREMRQGNAITRRMAIDPRAIQSIPELSAVLDNPRIKALFRYVSSFDVEPLHYIQTIVTTRDEAGRDPQEGLHADTFHSSMKAWLFLTDVAEDAAPFTFVPGSHRLSDARLAWEYDRSVRALDQMDRLSARGSPRVGLDDLETLGLPGPRALAVPANTLVVADTFGFHARGVALEPVERLELWSYSRRNPYLPWLGGDLFSLPGLAERRVGWLWMARDRLETWVGQPWKPVGTRRPVDHP